MIEETTYQHYRAFICGAENYDEIIAISDSQPNVHGSVKTVMYKDIFRTKIKQILNKTNDKLFISAVRNMQTKELLSYMITSIPYDQSCFMFFYFGEMKKSNDYFSQNNGAYGVWKLGLMNGEEKGSFDAFFTVQANAYRPIIRFLKASNYLTDGVVRYNWQLNNIVMPDEFAKNTIEKILILDSPNVLERIHPIAVCHASLKPEERIKKFADYFGDRTEKISNESVQG